jgi:hypothetical protein
MKAGTLIRIILFITALIASACGRSHLVGPSERARAVEESNSHVAAAMMADAAAPVSMPYKQSVRASYFYDYMPAAHLDSLAAVGMNRAVIKWITDTLTTKGALEFKAFLARGTQVEVVPCFNLQATARLRSLPTSRRYTWGTLKNVEADIGCPLDSIFWRSVFLDRANEIFAVAPNVKRLVVDLEFYSGTRHHYDAGACKCARCLAENANRPRTQTLEQAEERRLTTLLIPMLAEFANRHPGVEVGFFDLDFDSFVHRALGMALMATRVPTADYTERTYSTGAPSLLAARSALNRVGIKCPLIGGFWFKRFTPANFTAAAKTMIEQSDGYFVFTTYSLWQDPAKLTSGYTLLGTPSEYWAAMRDANQ